TFRGNSRMLSIVCIVDSTGFRHHWEMNRALPAAHTELPGPVDRRTTSRFPLTEEVRYKLSHGKVVTLGMGKTLNIGSGGVLFTTEQPLPAGRTVEVSI